MDGLAGRCLLVREHRWLRDDQRAGL